ncbi:MAG TPA: site-specific integrase [Firmicutes bacterium]|nr:site-specific integrase [Bacillota bacterium]
MAGQIIQRGENIFLVRVFLGRDKDGKRRYHNKTIHGTKKDAQRYLTAVLRERDLGTFAEPTRMTVDEYLDKWLATVARPRVSPRTYEDYDSNLRRYVRKPLGAKRLHQVTPLEIQEVYTTMIERGLAPRTVRYVHAVLNNALEQAVKWGFIARNPAQYVELPGRASKEMHAMSREEVERFLQAAQSDPFYTLFLVAITTGMRPGEYLALQWKDVDFEAGKVSVRRTLARRHDRQDENDPVPSWYFKEPKTPGSRRSIKLSPTVLQALRVHKARQAEERLAAGQKYHNLDLVFATDLGLPVHEHNLVRRHFKPILQKAGLSSETRLYDLRHTCATLLLKAGVHPKIVSELLGHSTVKLTLDTYSHVLPDMQQQVSDGMEALLFSDGNPKAKKKGVE